MPKLWETLISNISIVEEIQNYVDLTRKGQNYIGICPFHDDSNPSFTVNEQKKIFKCFVCNVGGNVIKFEEMINNSNFEQSMISLGTKYNIDISSLKKKNINNPIYNSTFKEVISLNHDVSELFEHELKINNEARLYLTNKRKLTNKTIEKFNLGFKNDDMFEVTNILSDLGTDFNLQERSGLLTFTKSKIIDFFSNRIMIPIRDEFNNIVGFGSRSINSLESIKYLNTKDSDIFKKRNILFNYKNAVEDIRKLGKTEIIVVEGYMDVISLANRDINNVVGVMTNNITKEQVKKLVSLNKKIILCLDSDNAGISGMTKFIKTYPNVRIEIMLLKKDYDPDEFITEFGRDKFLQRKKSTLEKEKFLLWCQSNNYDLGFNPQKDLYSSNIERVEDNYNIIPPERESIYNYELEDNIIHKEKEEFNNIFQIINHISNHISSYEEKSIFRHEFTIFSWLCLKYISNERAQEYSKIFSNKNISSWAEEILNNTISTSLENIINVVKESVIEKFDEDLDSKYFLIIYNWHTWQKDINDINKKLIDIKKDSNLFFEMKNKLINLINFQKREYIENKKIFEL